MASLVLQLNHHLCQLMVIDFKAVVWPGMADVIVLAKRTEQTAAAEENGSGAVLPNQHRFFSKMGAITGNRSMGSGATQAEFSSQPIDLAPAWTQGAFFQEQPALINPLIQQT
jgi:hypothetical protein